MKILPTVLTLFLAINIGVLYYIIFFGQVASLSHRIDVIDQRLSSLIKRDTPVTEPEVKSGDLIVLSEQQKKELVQLAVNEIGTGSSISSDQPTDSEDEADETSRTLNKEWYIPLGQAHIKTADNTWTTVPLEVEFDPGHYLEIQGIRFEAGLKIPTGNGMVQARLFDSVTGAIGLSEISSTSTTGEFVMTNTFPLSSGKRKLSVQMRTSMDYDGYLENARIRVIAKD